MIENHEDLGVLNMLAFQQKCMTEGFELFKHELTTVIKGFIEGQNAIKQELFIIRQNQVSEKKIADVDISIQKSPLCSTNIWTQSKLMFHLHQRNQNPLSHNQ